MDLKEILLGFGAFVSTLRDPAGQLVPSSDDEPPSCEPPAEGKIRLCAVQQSAKFYAEVNTKDNRLVRLGTKMTLGVLFQK